MSDWIRVPNVWSEAGKPVYKCPCCGEIYKCGYFEGHVMASCKGCSNVHIFPIIKKNKTTIHKIAMNYMEDLDESKRFKQLVAKAVTESFMKYKLKFTERDIIENVDSYCAWYVLRKGKLEMCEYDKYE